MDKNVIFVKQEEEYVTTELHKRLQRGSHH